MLDWGAATNLYTPLTVKSSVQKRCRELSGVENPGQRMQDISRGLVFTAESRVVGDAQREAVQFPIGP